MKYTTGLFMLGLVAACGTAQAGVSANIGVSSDYIYRGISNSSHKAALQGGLDYSAENGFMPGPGCPRWISTMASKPNTRWMFTLAMQVLLAM